MNLNVGLPGYLQRILCYFVIMIESFELNNPVTKLPSFKVCRFENDRQFQPLRSFNYFTVVLILKGKGNLTADASEFFFKGCSLMSFSLYQQFKITCPEGCEGYFVHFHPDFFCLHKHRSEVSCNGVLFNNIYESPLISLTDVALFDLSTVFKGMLSEMSRDVINTEILLSYLKILLIYASRIKVDLRNIEGNKDSIMPEKLIELQSAIEKNFTSMHNAAAYAKLISLSQSALNRACKDYFNKTLSDLISERIVLEAKRELYLTVKPVKVIAYELGFDDEFHFSRYFKRNIGISPKNFRDTVGVGKATAA